MAVNMYEYFANVWHAIGWDNFVPVEEYGSQLLTIKFFCSLWEVEIIFNFFWERVFAFLENFCWPHRFQQTLANFS